MTRADRLAEAVENRLPDIDQELDALYADLDRKWDDGVESAVNEIRNALAAYRSAPLVDIAAAARELHALMCVPGSLANCPECETHFDDARAVLREAGVSEGGGE